MASGLKVHSGIAPTPPGSQTAVVPSSGLLATAEKIQKIESRYLNLCADYIVCMQSDDPDSFDELINKVTEFSKDIESDLDDEVCKSHYLNQIGEDKVSEYIEKKFQDLEISPRKRPAQPSVLQPPIKKPKLSEGESIISLRGFPNLGDTCFANAVLQLLFQTPGIDQILDQKMTVDTDPQVISLEEKIKAAQGNQPETARLMGLLETEKQKASERIKFRDNLKLLRREFLKPTPNIVVIENLLIQLWDSPALSQLQMRRQQEDAQEFLVLVLDILKGEAHPNFSLTTVSMRINPTTHKQVLAHEVKESVQLPIPKQSPTLQGCFDAYLQAEPLERAEIAGLEEDVDCTSKRLFFTGQPPEPIQLGLKRFNHVNQKIITPIAGFDQPVVVPFCDAEGKVISQAAFQVDAVVCHDGRSPHSGHYTTFFKTSDGWLELNDRYKRKYSHADGLAVIAKNGYIVKARRV